MAADDGKENPTAKGRRPRKPVTIDLEAAGKEDTTGAPEKTADAKAGASETGAKTEEKTAPAGPNDTKKPVDRPAAPSAAAPKPGRVRSLLHSFTAALIGGIVALAVVYGLNRFGVLPATIGKTPQALTDRLSAIETRLDGTAKTLDGLNKAADDTATLAERVAALDKSATASTAARTADEKRIAALEATLAAAKLGELTAALGAAREDIAGARAEIATLRRAISSGDAGGDAALRTLEERLTKLSERVAGLADGGKAVADFETRLGKLESAGPAGKPGATAGLEPRIAAIRAALDGLANRVAALEAGGPSAAGASSGTLALAVATSALQTAFADGRPFRRELDAVGKLMDLRDRRAALEPLAATGLPSTQALQRKFHALRASLRSALAPKSDGLVDRLLDGAKSVVKVRRVDGGAEAGEPELVARIAERVDKGDFAGALEAWGQLPEAAKKVSSDWAAAVSARVAADALIGDALERLGK